MQLLPVQLLIYHAPEVSMTAEEFYQFRDLIYVLTNIYCAEAQRPLFERKIQTRIQALHLPSFRAYFEYLTHHQERSQERLKLIDAVAVHETSFFRIRDHFTGLTNLIFPKLFARDAFHAVRHPIRIWSAGCSTGEEPYSILLTFLETVAHRNIPASPRPGVRLFATDMSPATLEKAKQGVYSPEQVAKIEQPLLDKYFTFSHNYYITEDVKRWITFQVFNLIDLQTHSFGKFDILFCRNVLIYFDKKAQIQLLNGLIGSLTSGGYLFLGDTESTHLFPDAAKMLHIIESGNAIIYQKRGENAHD